MLLWDQTVLWISHVTLRSGMILQDQAKYTGSVMLLLDQVVYTGSVMLLLDQALYTGSVMLLLDQAQPFCNHHVHNAFFGFCFFFH